MPYNSLADVVLLLAERYDTKSNIKLGGFRSQLQASYESSHTEELWYNETVCLCLQLFNTSDLWFDISLLLQDAIASFSSMQRKQLLSPALYLRHFFITSHFITGSIPLLSLSSHT